MHEFTFLITAYNPGPFVLVTLNSMLNQTYPNFTILYIDDCSSDASCALVEAIPDNRITVIKNAERLGLIKSLNFGLDLITTKYLIRFDADDVLLPNFLKTRVENIETGVILLGENMLITNGDLKFIGKTNFPGDDNAIKSRLLHLKNAVNQPGVLLARDAVVTAGGYKHVKAAEDYDLWIRMIGLGRFKNTDSYQLMYRVTGQSLTTNTFDHIAKSNILSLSGHKEGILLTRAAKLYVYLFQKYNHCRGLSFQKLFFYPLYHLYRILYSQQLRKYNYNLKPAFTASL